MKPALLTPSNHPSQPDLRFVLVCAIAITIKSSIHTVSIKTLQHGERRRADCSICQITRQTLPHRNANRLPVQKYSKDVEQLMASGVPDLSHWQQSSHFSRAAIRKGSERQAKSFGHVYRIQSVRQIVPGNFVYLGDYGVLGKVAVNNVCCAQLLQQCFVSPNNDDVLDLRKLCKLHCKFATVGTSADDQQAAGARFVVLPWDWQF
jgi:hypothetical protein